MQNKKRPLTFRTFIGLVIASLIVMIGMSYFVKSCEAQDRNVSGNITYMTKGIAPVPSFAIEDGAFYASMLADLGRFEILMDMAVDDGRVDRRGGEFWFSDLWLRYYPVKNETTKVRGAINWSPFGQWYGLVLGLNNDTTSFVIKSIHEVTRYLIFEGYAERSLSPKTSVSVQYWYNRGFGERTIKGSFLMLALSGNLALGDFAFTAKPALFGISFTGESDGLFLSETASLSYGKLPFVLSSQAVIPLSTNIPDIKTSWNVALTYLF